MLAPKWCCGPPSDGGRTDSTGGFLFSVGHECRRPIGGRCDRGTEPPDAARCYGAGSASVMADYIVMAYIEMAYIVMACIVVAYIVMA